MILLDTDTCIYLTNHRPPSVRARLDALDLNDVAISSITLFELDAGVRNGSGADRNLRRLERFASLIQVFPFDARAARDAGELRQWLRRRGTPIGDMDTLIAAHARALDATVVTNNVKEFGRVPGLRVENWLSTEP